MRSLVWKLVLAALTLALAAAPVPRQPAAWAAAPALEEAQSLYDGAQFSEAITKIRGALSTAQLTGTDAFEARVLLARCLVKEGDRLEAKQAFKFVLRQQPGWHPDPNVVPPDEQEVFQLAQQELTGEQISAGKRIPASLSINIGTGSSDNSTIRDFVKEIGGPSGSLDGKAQLGGSVRFPLSQHWSIELELQRLRATKHFVDSGSEDLQLEVTAYPISVSLYHPAYSLRQFRVNLFAGGGLLSSSIASLTIPVDFGSGPVPITLSGEKTSVYAHGGLEAEILLHPRLAMAGRIMGRYAKANDVFSEYGTFADAYKNRDVDFSGFAATFGLRAYIGY